MQPASKEKEREAAKPDADKRDRPAFTWDTPGTRHASRRPPPSAPPPWAQFVAPAWRPAPSFQAAPALHIQRKAATAAPAAHNAPAPQVDGAAADKSGCACGTPNTTSDPCPGCLKVLAAASGAAPFAVSNPTDPAEREADALAARVLAPSATPHGSEVAASATLSGAPLDHVTRHDFESRFGHDFGQVRVHTDSHAAQSARAFEAAAYTVGHDIVFGEGRYAPGTEAGRHLLAHELAHVVQKSPPQVVARQSADARSPAPSVAPDIAKIPFGLYVDKWTDVIYDSVYKRRGNFDSTIMRVRYDDGTVIEIDINAFDENPMSRQEFLDSMAEARVGEGGRLFPRRMTELTTPRLWAVRREVRQQIDNNFIDFAGIGLTGALLVISLPGLLGGPPRASGGPRRIPIIRQIPKGRTGLPPLTKEPPPSQAAPPQPADKASRPQSQAEQLKQKADELNRQLVDHPTASTGDRLAAGRALAGSLDTVYNHTLTKGGLRSILKTNELLPGPGTAAGGGAEGVRAHFGDPGGVPAQAPTITFTNTQPANVPHVRLFMGGRVGVQWSSAVSIRIKAVRFSDGGVGVPQGRALKITRPGGKTDVVKFDDLPD